DVAQHLTPVPDRPPGPGAARPSVRLAVGRVPWPGAPARLAVGRVPWPGVPAPRAPPEWAAPGPARSTSAARATPGPYSGPARGLVPLPEGQSDSGRARSAAAARSALRSDDRPRPDPGLVRKSHKRPAEWHARKPRTCLARESDPVP